MKAIQLDGAYGMQNYARKPVTFVKGRGTKLWDHKGKEYTDFLAGIAVCGLGHCHPAVAQAIAKQAQELVHTSNLFHHPLQPQLAQRLCQATGMDRVFFCNSGTEANEAAIKIARLWGHTRKGPDCHKIVTLTGSFHGRTMGSLAATANPGYQAGFEPLPGGFTYVGRNSTQALKAAVGKNTCAVMLEPIQGEGGVNVLEKAFLLAAQKLCKERGALLILDEVQTGIGRTGKFLAAEHFGLQPDIVTLAKGIANGVPMGACLAKWEAAELLRPGHHGSTFGGNPLACAAAVATLDTIAKEDLLVKAAQTGQHLKQALQSLVDNELACEVRGMGLMIGIELPVPIAGEIANELLKEGFVVGTAGDSVIRLLPPLIITSQECDALVVALHTALSARSPL